MRLVIPMMLLLSIALFSSFTARAAEADPAVVYDISWPQCGKVLPVQPYVVGIVGVDGGKAFTQNPCLRVEYQWAAATGRLPPLYMTLRYPSGPTAARGMTGPAGNCAETDLLCITFNYGFRAAEEAARYARAEANVPDETMWWLDVETMSAWSNNTVLNARVVEGAIAYFAGKKIAVGVYSTAAQWRGIVGNFTPGLPAWIGGAPNAAVAASYCGQAARAFNGGKTWMVQYVAGKFDVNVLCSEDIVVATTPMRERTSASTIVEAAPAPPPKPAPPPAPAASVPPPAPAPKAQSAARADTQHTPAGTPERNAARAVVATSSATKPAHDRAPSELARRSLTSPPASTLFCAAASPRASLARTPRADAAWHGSVRRRQRIGVDRVRYRARPRLRPLVVSEAHASMPSPEQQAHGG